MGLTLGATAPRFPNTESTRAIGGKTGTKETPSPVPLVDTSKEHLVPLSTPINVTKLEEVLREHPDPAFVARLCSFFRTGADIGFTGPRIARFSKNLPTALAQPDIVSENLTKEVAFGRVGGPFPTPPFPNLQVSPIGLVPKKHSNKFRTIFHLVYVLICQ
jgi:hypothetical protein